MYFKLNYCLFIQCYSRYYLKMRIISFFNALSPPCSFFPLTDQFSHLSKV
uniref:Uncharacterized protein n=1 Tax=Arundo donax TaxID=35708 RepID=A0A0A9CKM7_ARUDO